MKAPSKRFTVHGLYWYFDGAFLSQSRDALLEDETTLRRAVLSFHNAI